MQIVYNPFTDNLDFVGAVNAGDVTNLTGNSGTATASGGNINVVTANATPKFVGSGNTLTLDFGLSNLALGTTLPNITSGISNVVLGSDLSGSSITSGQGNTYIGTDCAIHATVGYGNVAVGGSALSAYTTGVGGITAIGFNCLHDLQTGINVIALGSGAGLLYESSESHNIVIGNPGSTGESNVIRIGTQGSGNAQQNECFIAGIVGVTASNPELVTVNSSTGQMGVQALTQYELVVGGASNAVAQLGTGSSGQVLQSGGNAANPAYSTATYPSVATGTNKILVADGTNWVASTPTFPNASATAGKVIVSDGTNWIASTPTFPNASATTRKIIVSNGTNWVASTETYAVPGTSANVMTSDGTNWTSAKLPAASSNALVSLNTTISNVTGDNTFYGPIIFDTVAFDSGSNYNATTGFFTAPTTGKYLCCCSCSLQNLAVGHTSGEFRLEVAGSTYSRSSFNPYIMSASGIYTYTFSLVVPVTASQTLAFGAVVAGSTQTVGIQGNSFGIYSFASFTYLGN